MQLFEVCPRRCKYLPYNNPNHTTAGSASINPEERNKKERQVRRAKKRKRTKAQRAKPSTQSQAIDAHIGDEERNGNQKRKKKKEKKGAGPQPGYPDVSIFLN